MSYLMYLRKSRADKDAEARGEGETLARHEQILSELAVKMGISIGAIYKEIVSGETISARPKMQQLLIEVMQGKWDGVLVMEVERLARGDTKDQGTVAETFKFGNTKIVTPLKVYDPQNEYDEEYFEFNLFMSRREYKTINRRIQRGRIAAFNDGWYISGTAPYGYKKVKHKEDKGWTLDIVEEEAAIVRMIFDLYTIGALQDDGSRLHYGSYQIRDRLNELQIASRTGAKWSAPSVMDILRNPTYSGYQRWSWRKVQKELIDGEIRETRPKNDNCPIVKGRFEAIITETQFTQAQKIRKNRPFNIQPVKVNTLQNPLSGLVYCEKCKTMMTRQPSNTKNRYAILRCPNSKCNNISAPIYLIEKKILDALEDWLINHNLEWPENSYNNEESSKENLSRSINNLQTKYEQIVKQISSAYDLLEQGIYTIDIFQERHKSLESQKDDIAQELDHLKNEQATIIARTKARKEFIPSVKHIIDTYYDIEDIHVKNSMLKDVLEKIDYLKTVRNKKGERDTANFSLRLYPRIPERQ